MTTARSYDRLNQLMGISSVPSGANQLPLSFDEYTNRAVPGYVDVLGIGTATAAVTVNGTGAYRRGEYFHVALAVDNSSGPQYPSIVIQAVAGANSASSTGSVFLAKTPETFVHDADGNLTQDGRWAYTWDGENRLMAMEALSTVPSAAKLRLEFEYDWRGRRIGKTVKAWSGTSYTNVCVLKFLYDGWNLAAELDANNAVVRSYIWGTDLSGSDQGAGGVGGLLAVNVATNGVHFPAYDGNGNIAGLVSAASGAITARFEYGPFAEPIRVSGLVAKVMPLRFSTKYLDEETGLYYYGYRYYDPSTGRWVSRDPIGERGGLNLYGFVGNNPTSRVDVYGLMDFHWYNPISWFWPGYGGPTYSPPLPIPDPYTYGAMHGIDNDFNGLTGAEVATEVGLAVPKGIAIAAMLMTPLGKEEEAADAAGGLWNALKNKLSRSKCPTKAPKFKDLKAALDASGRVHGPLPNPAELGRYHPEDLQRLLQELQQSVQSRIENTANLGATVGHDARIAEEQQLIQAILKQLGE